jgi:hypothetical protein
MSETAQKFAKASKLQAKKCVTIEIVGSFWWVRQEDETQPIQVSMIGFRSFLIEGVDRIDRVNQPVPGFQAC